MIYVTPVKEARTAFGGNTVATMGGLGSKQSLTITAGKYRVKRHIRQLCAQRKRNEDVVQQSRPTRFFNVTKTSVEASVAVNKKVRIRAYLVPDGGTAAIHRIEFEAEPDVDHILEFGDLRPGTLYRLKLYYVISTYKRVLSSTGTYLRREGREILQSLKSDKLNGRRQTSGAATEKKPLTEDAASNSVVIRRATRGAAVEDATGHHEKITGVSLPKEGFSGEKPLGIPMNYPKKLEVRTLPADWKGREYTHTITRGTSAVGPARTPTRS